MVREWDGLKESLDYQKLKRLAGTGEEQLLALLQHAQTSDQSRVLTAVLLAVAEAPECTNNLNKPVSVRT